jgi:hypothetical protein
MKRLLTIFTLLCCVVLMTTAAWGQVTWTGTAGDGLWTSATNWSGSAVPTSTDIVQFNNGGTLTITAVPTVTIQQLILSNNTTVNLQAGAAATVLTIGGGTGTDLVVPSGSALNINGTNTMKILVATGATGSISGSMLFSGAVHNLDATDASGITFNNGATFTYNPGSTSGNAFTNAGTANAIIFASGSSYIYFSGANPFGLAAPSSKVTFQTGSLYSHQATVNGTPSFSNRTYADVEIKSTFAVWTVTGGSAVSINNLTITSGTLNFNMTGTSSSIKGNITVASGATLNFAPASASSVNLNGTVAQTISGAGTITATVNSTLVVNNSNGVTLNHDLTLPGTLTLTSGTLSLGANILALNGTLGGTATNLSTISASSLVFAGTTAITIPSSVTALNNLTVNNTAGVTLNAATTINGLLSIGTGAFVNLGTFTHTANQLSLGGVGQTAIGTWGSTSSAATNTNNTYFAATTGTVTVASSLPVELVSFTATGTRNGASLVWKTATEKNNYGFNIERRVVNSQSSIVNSWSKVGFVAGHGTSNSANSYSYADANVAAGTYAYRVAQVDNDGTVKTYNESEVTIGAAAKVLTLGNYPNPFNPTTTFEFSVPNDGLTTVKIYNVLGQELVTAFSGEVKAGQYNHATFDGSKFSSGVYFYSIENNGQHMIKKMLMLK